MAHIALPVEGSIFAGAAGAFFVCAKAGGTKQAVRSTAMRIPIRIEDTSSCADFTEGDGTDYTGPAITQQLRTSGGPSLSNLIRFEHARPS